MSTDVKQDKPSRRQFLGGAAAVALLGGCTNKKDPYSLNRPAPPKTDKHWARGQERWITTSCAQCPAGCSVKVRVVEGRAVQITGDPDCPINRGGIGPRGLAGLQVLYDPDRIKGPLKRRDGPGPRRDRPLEPIEWEEALSLVASRLGSLREKRQAHRVAIMCGRDRGCMLELWQRFATAFGTPNIQQQSAWSMGSVAHASELMLGVREMHAFDWSETNYLLTLGSGALESSCQRVYFLRAAADMVRGHRGRRARIVHADPALPSGTTVSDEWLPIRPGSHGALAMGLCHVLIREQLFDHAFVTKHCVGFEDEAGSPPRLGFKSLALRDYSPEKVAKICDIPAETIERVATEMTQWRPAIAIIDPAATLTHRGTWTTMAVLALNALLGAFNQRGGIFLPTAPPLADWPEVMTDAVATHSLSQPSLDPRNRYAFAESVPQSLPEAILKGEPYAPEALLLYYSNPCYSTASPARWRKALDRVPFVVSFTPFMDDTAAEHADLILPDHTFLERWEDAAPAPAVREPIFGLRRPVVEPIHNTRASGDLVIDIAQRLGPGVAEAFPWKSFRKALEARIDGLHQSQRGSIVAGSSKKFLRKLRKAGFWVDNDPSAAAARGVPTITLNGSRLRERLAALASRSGLSVEELASSWGLACDNDTLCMPSFPAAASQSNDPTRAFTLIAYRPPTYAEGSGANQPWLQTLRSESWETQVEINPTAAATLGIAAGDRVDVTSTTGTIRGRAQLYEGIRPDSVRIACGLGHRAFGRWAKNLGANVMEIIASKPDPVAGLPTVLDTRVSVRKA